MAEQGRYIVFEGSDGSGKTTQAKRAAHYLRGEGHDVVETFEPGASSIGISIRNLVLFQDTTELAPASEVLLFTAERSQIWHEIIQPALEAGKVVISDRNWFSTWVYQGASNEELGEIGEEIVHLALPKRYYDPDLCLYFEVDESTRQARMNAGLDKIERRRDGYFERVNQRYSQLPSRFGAVAIDGTGTPEEVQQRTLLRITEFMNASRGEIPGSSQS